MQKSFEHQVLNTAIFSSSIIWIADIVYWVMRKGFPIDFQSLIMINGIGFFLLFSAWFIIKRFPEKNFVGNASSIPLYFLILFCFGGLFFGDGIVYVAYVFAAIGFALFGYALVEFIKIGQQRLVIIGISFFLGAWTVCKVWGTFSLHPLFTEAIAFLTEKELPYMHDTLFHASFAQMFKTYNAASTGLDGLPLMYYHYGSHWLLGHLSSFVGVDVIMIYNAGYPIIFVPLFIYTFILLSTDLQRFFCGRVLTNNFFWICMLCFFIPIPKGGYSLGLLGISLLVNESQTISMIFLFALFSILLNFDATINKNRVLYLLIIPVAIAAIGFIKISTAFVIVPFLGYVYLKYRGYKDIMFTASLLLSIGGFLLAYFYAVETIPFLRTKSYEGTFEFFHFYKNTHDFNLFHWIGWFYFWTYAAIFFNVYYRNKMQVQQHSRWLILEAVVIIALVGVLPSMIMSFAGGNSMYFSNVQLYIGGVCCFGLFPLIFDEAKNFYDRKSYQTLKTSGLLIVVATIFILCWRETMKDFKRVMKKSVQVRYACAGKDFSNFATFSTFDTRIKESYGFDVSEALKTSAPYQFLANLNALDSKPLSEKKVTVVYKPCDCQNDIKWNNHNCLTRSHLVSAYSGFASIYGIPAQCDIGMFGSSYYTDFYSNPGRKFSSEDANAWAQSHGFKKVLFYDCEEQKFEDGPFDCSVQ